MHRHAVLVQRLMTHKHDYTLWVAWGVIVVILALDVTYLVLIASRL